VIKLSTRFERNRTIRGGVIDDLPQFRRTILTGSIYLRTALTGAWTKL